jgi:NDP-sugar pyrophosphorylase family protein
MGTTISGRSVVCGPSIVGENCEIGPNAFIDPCTVIGDRCHIASAEIDDSTLMKDAAVNLDKTTVRSMVGGVQRFSVRADRIPRRKGLSLEKT